MAIIRTATLGDLDSLACHEHHIARELLQQKILDSQIYVAVSEADGIVGWLRYGLFWDCMPFMNMLYFLEPYRQKGLGRQIVERWEADMRCCGFDQVLTSTQVDEDGQHFYRHLGYVDAGVLLLPGQPAELLLRRSLE
jgi:GNAT superfamily N-acetyltransferase